MPRVPTSCPPGFGARYTVQPGDTMFFIAETFDTSLQALIAANPQIPNPNLIFPGDVLCVPGTPPAQIPCCAVLGPQSTAVRNASATALVRVLSSGERDVTLVTSNLPAPASLGAFDSYEGLVTLPSPESGAFGFMLFATPGDSGTYSGSLHFPLPGGFEPFPQSTLIEVRPANSQTGVSGPVVLRTNLSRCGG